MDKIDKINEEFSKITQHDVSLIDETVKPQKMDKFQELLKIANPNLEKKFYDYSTDEQLLLAEFTRLFNIKQLLYILTTYKTGVDLENYIICKIKQTNESLLTKFYKKYGNNAYLEEMSTFDLIGCEIQANFADDKDMPLIHQVQKVALTAFRIERDFHFKEWKYKEKELEHNAVVNLLLKKRYLMYKENVEKQKRLWDEFEVQYVKYLEENKGVEGKEEETDPFYSVVSKKKVIPIDYTNQLLRNTTTFLDFIDKNPKLPVARLLKELYESYAEKLDLDSASVNLVSGHIHYFRLLNIAKILILAERYGLTYVYYNVDMLEIISEPLMNVRTEEPELLNMEEEYAAQLVLNDAAIILGNGSPEVLSNQDNIKILFTVYLDIEKTWLLYEVQKLLAMTKKPSDKLILRDKIAKSKLVKNYFEYYKETSKYYEFLNRSSGKVLDFPS